MFFLFCYFFLPNLPNGRRRHDDVQADCRDQNIIYNIYRIEQNDGG